MSPTAPVACVLLVAVSAAEESALGGWRIDQEHRFVWIRSQRKVGETTFSLARIDGAGGKPAIEIRASRSYDDQGDSHRGRSATRLRPDGEVERFEESLELSFQNRGQSHQKTIIEIASGKARIEFRQKEKSAALEVESSEPMHLTASQAVEHWVLLAARLPKTFEKHEVNLLYPDFGKTIKVQLTRTGAETLQLGTGKVSAERYQFSASADNLQGSFWRDEQGRLVQIEFPNKLAPQRTLRVVLAGPAPAPAKN